MQKIMVFIILGASFILPTCALSLSAQDCRIADEFYDWTPNGCEGAKSGYDPSLSEAEGARYPSNVQRKNHVFFVRGGAGLDSEARAQIATLARILTTDVFAPTCVALIGHSDAVGSEAANKRLAQRRANAVKSELLLNGDLADRDVVSVSMGESVPLQNLNVQSPWQRRVEIRVKNCSNELNE